MKQYQTINVINRNQLKINQFLKSKLRISLNKSVLDYQIREKIGSGSFAKVYKAIHRPTSEVVAVKIYNKNYMKDSDFIAVYRQVQLHKKLVHKNIAKIYQFYQNQEKLYIFMEYCENGELFHFINSNGPIEEKHARKIFKQILSALKYLKSQKIFHRDIKCQNIMFDKNWNSKLIDFGFATKVENGVLSRAICGSPSYTAPQIIRQQRYNAQTSDAWSLGVTLYAMLTSRLPFEGKNPAETRQNILAHNFKLSRNFSHQLKQVFYQIFVEAQNRLSFEDIQETIFCKNNEIINANNFDQNPEEQSVSSYILHRILTDHNVNPLEVYESVTKHRLDQKYSLYQILCKKYHSRGATLYSNNASTNFDKSYKNFKLINELKAKQKLITIDKNFKDLNIPELKINKDRFRIRASIHSLGTQSRNTPQKRKTQKSSTIKITNLLSQPTTCRTRSSLE